MAQITEKLLRDRLTELKGMRAKILEKDAPVEAERNKLLEKIQPLELQMRRINDRRKKIRQPLFDIDMEIGLITKSLPGDRTVPAVAVEVVEAADKK